MKIGYFADGRWGQLALKQLLSNDMFEICFITPRFDTQDPVLKELAEQNDIPFLPSENVNGAEFLELVRPFGADLFVSMSFNQILRKEIRLMPPLGFINCHAGALPFYRGRNPLNWVLINGEKSFGITVHYVDAGIDTGDIILQKHFDISIDDSYGTLLDVACEECAAVLVEAIEQIENKTAARIEQSSIAPVGFYCSRRREGDERLNWNMGSLHLHNFIRGISLPGPCARTRIEAEEFGIISSELIMDAPRFIGINGEVSGRDKGGITIKTGDSSLYITKICKINEAGECGAGYIPSFPIGTRFNHW